jgi:hypothetical protein
MGHERLCNDSGLTRCMSPWSGETVAVVAAGDDLDTRSAIEAADAAFPMHSRNLSQALTSDGCVDNGVTLMSM